MADAKYDHDAIKAALEAAHGNVTEVARQLHFARPTLAYYIRRYDDLQAIIDQAHAAEHPGATDLFDPAPGDMQDVITATQGNLKEIAARYGVRQYLVRDYLRRHPVLADLAAEARLPESGNGRGDTFEPDPQEMRAQIYALNANLAGIAHHFGVERHTVYRYLDRHPEMNEIVQDAREAMVDLAEASLFRAVLNGEAWAVMMFLRTKGRSRGYIERVDTFAAKLDLNKLSVEQLQRIAAGEHPSLVLGQPDNRLLTAGPRAYPAASAGEGLAGTEITVD